MLGGHFVTVGKRCFDVGILKLAGILEDLYRVKDFASDAAVLELCSSKSIQKILKNREVEHEDEGSVMVTLLCMLFLRIFIVTSSSSDVPKKQAMALLWSCLLFFTSINMAMVTKRNIVASILPMVCLIAQKRVQKPQLLTSEPAEHYFGCARQWKHEFSCSDFASYVENLEIALKEMVQYDLRSGGGKGYVAGFCSFLRDLVKTSNSSLHETESESQPNLNVFEGVDVDYTDQNVANQIENTVLPCLNAVVADMKTFLQVGLGIDPEQISPFARSFADFNDIAATYYSYLPEKIRTDLKDHTFPPQDSNASELDNIEMDLNENEVNDLFDNVVKFVLQQDKEDEIIPDASSFMIPMNSLQDDICNPEENIFTWPLLKNVISTVIRGVRDQPQQTEAMYSAIFSCMDSVYHRRITAASDDRRFNSLQGRWWGKARTDSAAQSNSQGQGAGCLLRRGMLIVHENGKTYMILNVFQKSYNKWRLEDSGTPSKKGQVKIQAICVRPRELYDNEYELCDYLRGDQFLNIDAYKLRPFASIWERGQTEPM